MGPKKPLKTPGTPKIRAFKFIQPSKATSKLQDESEDGSASDLSQRPSRATRRIMPEPAAKSARSKGKQKEPTDSTSAQTTPLIPPPETDSDEQPTLPDLTQQPPTKKKTKKKDTVSTSQSDTSSSVSTKKKMLKEPQPHSSKTVQRPKKDASKSQSKVPTSAPKKSKTGKPLKGKASVSNQPIEEEAPPSPTPPQDEVDDFASDPENEDIDEADKELEAVLMEEASKPDSPIVFGRRRKWINHKFNQEEDGKLIEFIKKHEIFYNKNRTDFKENPSRDVLMLELEAEMKIPGKSIFGNIFAGRKTASAILQVWFRCHLLALILLGTDI